MTEKELQEMLEKHKIWIDRKEGERACLGYADLRNADLSYADLRYANLSHADLNGADISYAPLANADLRYANLSGADLRYANLRGADLNGANLGHADLSGANLGCADLNGADLNGANLSGANLRCANLGCADLRCANLRGADLNGADLNYVKSNENTIFFALQCPEEGSFVAWKKCRNDVIVKLLIPEDAKRSSATSRKCRASKAVVLEVIGAEKAISTNDASFVYEAGKEVVPDSFDGDRWNECSHGIHFFITRKEAENY